MKIPGMRFVRKAESTGNEVEVPLAHNLGLVELLKRTFKEASEDHLAAFAGNLTYKVFFALFPFFVFLLSLLGIFGAPELLGPSSTGPAPCCPRTRQPSSKISSWASRRTRPRTRLPWGRSFLSSWPSGACRGRSARSWRR